MERWANLFVGIMLCIVPLAMSCGAGYAAVAVFTDSVAPKPLGFGFIICSLFALSVFFLGFSELIKGFKEG